MTKKPGRFSHLNQHSKAKIKRDDLSRIIEFMKNGQPIKVLAEQFAVSYSYMCRIKRKHLTC